jgi:hypothetical protein
MRGGEDKAGTAKGRQFGKAECYYRRPILRPAGMLLVMRLRRSEASCARGKAFTDFSQRGCAGRASVFMRLTKLKLAGFKSFVDPTNIALPGQLVGVVGPNGCGKSNVIDSVRWVLGESKASELRGESMQDVIFNGSGSRKPVSRAAVELVFDNTLGRLSGQWSQYAELSVKRLLTRNWPVRVLHQQPARAPQGCHRPLSRHRPRSARLRDHRPRHHLADHRGQAGRTARLPRRGGRRDAATRSGARKPAIALPTRVRT